MTNLTPSSADARLHPRVPPGTGAPAPVLGGGPTDEPQLVVLVGLDAAATRRLTSILQQVIPSATLRGAKPEALAKAPAIPAGTLLILADRLTGGGSGVDLLRRLRAEGHMTPAVVVSEEDLTEDVWALGNADLIPGDEFSALALRRSLSLFSGWVSRQRMVAGTTQRFNAYERVLESKDEERAWIMKVASDLKRRLAAAEDELRQAAEAGRERLERSEAERQRLERRLVALERSPSAQQPRPEDSQRLNRLEIELAYNREELGRRDQTIAELHRTLASQQAEIGERPEGPAEGLAAELEASENVRRAQTQEVLQCQRRIGDLEQHLETFATLLQADGASVRDPEVLLGELAQRLTSFEKVRQEQQGTIDQLSHSLAMQQVDDTLDDAQSRRNVVQRLGESVRRAQRFGVPLFCVMIGIDHPQTLRAVHGPVSYGFLLVQIAQRLRLTLRQNDVMMRYDEEGFVLIPEAKSLIQVRSLAERLIKTICGEPLEMGSQQLEPSISISMLQYQSDVGGANELIRQARQTLAEAQTRGEQQIGVHLPSSGC